MPPFFFSPVLWYAGSILRNRNLKRVKQFADVPPNSIIEIFNCCRAKLNLKKQIQILQCDIVTTPLSFGCKKPCIVLPSSVVNQSSDKAIEHILLHELTHIRNKDVITNTIFCIGQAIYWFNPLIWWAFSKMRNDRETYCDWSVLNDYDIEEERLNYGDTLLRFASENNHTRIYTANSLYDSKAQIKYRIEKIADYKHTTKK